jgi:hypothetical protein
VGQISLELKLKIAGGVAAAVLFVLLSGWKGQVQESADRLLLRYNAAMRIMAYLVLALGIVFPIGLFVLLVLEPPPAAWHYLAAGGTGFFMLALAVFQGREHLYALAVADKKGIEKYSPWFGRRYLAWSDVERIDVKPNGAIRIVGTDRSAVSFSAYWSGIDQLVEACQRELSNKVQWQRY